MRHARPYLYLVPAAILLCFVVLYPLAGTFWLSLHRSIVIFHDERFIGLDNYRFLLHDARFFAALGHTLTFTVVAVGAELLLGLCFALLMSLSRAKPRGFSRGRGLLRAAVLVPWAIPTVVSARLWAHLFDPQIGLVRDWLSNPSRALFAAIVADVWKTTPFVALILLAGLQTIPRDVYRAAQVDGAGALRTFWSVTLPLLRPALAVAAAFRALDALRVFDAIYVLTGGGPANATETLSIYAYKMLMRSGDFGYGSMIALATFCCVALLAAGYVRLVLPKELLR
jgi:multiple sugar transport system permease protein